MNSKNLTNLLHDIHACPVFLNLENMVPCIAIWTLVELNTINGAFPPNSTETFNLSIFLLEYIVVTPGEVGIAEQTRVVWGYKVLVTSLLLFAKIPLLEKQEGNACNTQAKCTCSWAWST